MRYTYCPQSEATSDLCAAVEGTPSGVVGTPSGLEFTPKENPLEESDSGTEDDTVHATPTSRVSDDLASVPAKQVTLVR